MMSNIHEMIMCFDNIFSTFLATVKQQQRGEMGHKERAEYGPTPDDSRSSNSSAAGGTCSSGEFCADDNRHGVAF